MNIRNVYDCVERIVRVVVSIIVYQHYSGPCYLADSCKLSVMVDWACEKSPINQSS